MSALRDFFKRPTQPPVRGYRKKPLRVRLLACSLLLAPALNFFYSLSKVDPNWQQPTVWAHYFRLLPPFTLSLIAVTMLTGFILLSARRFTWILGIVFALSVFIYNLIQYRDISVLLLVYLFFLLTPSMRRIYFNAQVRWWERAKRYTVSIPAQIFHHDAPQTFRIYDLSTSGFRGTFEKTYATDFDVQTKFRVEFASLGAFSMRWVRRHEQEHGFRFVDMPRAQRKQLKNHLEKLIADGQAQLITS